jgi:hypothetical protein
MKSVEMTILKCKEEIKATTVMSFWRKCPIRTKTVLDDCLQDCCAV